VTGSEYKKDKKYVVEKRVCIRKMVDAENMTPNDNFYQYYESEGRNEEKAPRFSDALQVGAPALLFQIMEELKISELLEYLITNPHFKWGFEKRPQGLCYCSPERRVSQAHTTCCR